MTVQELIAKLETMPKDALVIYRLFSEHDDLRAEQIELCSDFVKWGPVYMRFDGRVWDHAKSGQPELLTVCVFPGN